VAWGQSRDHESRWLRTREVHEVPEVRPVSPNEHGENGRTVTMAQDTSWISEPIVNEEAMRRAAARACREGLGPNRFIALSPVDQRVSRDARLKKQRLKGIGDCWTGAVQCAAKMVEGP
jgi:hypothetical protein